MDFENANPFNVQLNLISGNLLPMTADTSFSILWKIYSIFVWLIEALQTILLIYGCTVVSREIALQNAFLPLEITIEVMIIIMRIYARRQHVSRLIEKFNQILCLKNETINDTITGILKPIQFSFKFYCALGTMAVIVWCTMPFMLLLEKDYFFYVDYRMPVVYVKEPFSRGIFILGNTVTLISNIYIFIKKISVDSYIIHMIVLITAQYKYIASHLSTIFHDDTLRNNNSKESFDHYTEKEIKMLCRYHNFVLHITFMLKNLLSVNMNLMYVTSVMRFCFIGVMLLSIPSMTLLEAWMVILYAAGGILQLYLLCSRVQQLFDASIEVTDQAFHEGWYRYGRFIKRTFMMIIMANNLECRLSTVEKFNLSLPSLMSILNASYSIALLLLRTT